MHEPDNSAKNPASHSPEVGPDTGALPTVDAEATLDAIKSSNPAATRTGSSDNIGPYKLIKKLGEGGMGQVWLADQIAPVKRRVALKLIKGGRYDGAVIQRFEAERQSLAIMDHPAIAKVFDAGTTADGQPYFAMEYVDGLSITRYCDDGKLKISERLELFIRVCEGVQHAHQKAVMHRDLKPSNILVVEVDGKPMPRIIDFGIAKAISSQPGTDETMFTQIGARVGTPGFMSPEQADPNTLDVDTRTDVYSLGVVLYVLLTGSLPFDPATWQKKPIDEVLRQLREDDPPSPSALLRRDKETSEVRAIQRGTDPGQLVSLLRGDLDWITMKAAERDRSRRYGTPSELAADIQRHLENKPVIARPATTSYRLQKYVRRHRVGVAVATGLAGLLVTFGVMQAVQLRRVTRERDRADRISKFMTGMFKVSDPNEAKGNTITVREILDKGSKEINDALARDPDMQVQMLGTMGHVYINLGLFSQAQPLLEQAVAKGLRTLGTNNHSTLDSMSELSFLLMREGRYADAEKLLRQTIEGQRRAFGLKNAATLTSMRYLASTLELEGRYAEADRVEQETLNIARRALGPEHFETLLSMNVMANILDDEGRLPEAENLYKETAEIQLRTLGREHPDTMTTMSNLGGVLQEEGHLEEAEKIQRDTLTLRSRVLGAEHPDTLALQANLANTVNVPGRRKEAEMLYREVLNVQQKVLGAENPDTLSTVSSLANNLQQQGRYGDSETLLKETLNVRQRVLGKNHPDTLKTLDELAGVLSRLGRFDEAEKLYKDLIGRATESPEKTGLAGYWYDFACGAAVAGHRDEALQYLRQAIDHGFSDAEHMVKDEDLKFLQSDPRFTALVEDIRQRASSKTKN